jgi:hypothetical protein
MLVLIDAPSRLRKVRMEPVGKGGEAGLLTIAIVASSMSTRRAGEDEARDTRAAGGPMAAPNGES